MPHLLSWWEKSILLRPFDFAVLGSGLIGKQIAIKIIEKNPKARVAIIDRSPISYGASTRNAGFACFGSISEILDDLDRSSDENVFKLAEKRYRGIRLLLDTFGEDAIGYRPTGSYEIFTESKNFELAESEHLRINQAMKAYSGLEQVFNLKKTESLGMKCEPLSFYNPYEGMLNSGMLNETISDRAHRLGVIPLYGLNITKLIKTHVGYTLESEQGMEIHCKQLIIANNAFAQTFLPDEDIQAARGQIIITKPLDKIPFDGIFHSDKGYIYFRNLGNRILIGGGRNHFYNEESTFDMNGSDDIKTFLENYLHHVVIPEQAFETEMHWSGIMGMGKEKIPIVKRVDESLILCVRMSGMGVALGPVLSDEVMDLL